MWHKVDSASSVSMTDTITETVPLALHHLPLYESMMFKGAYAKGSVPLRHSQMAKGCESGKIL